MNVSKVTADMNAAAAKAAQDFLDRYYGGQDQGACGFAWVTIHPRYTGNTRLGKEERKLYAQLGAEKDWTGKSYMIWNPAKIGAQNVDCKEAGARAAQKVLQEAGLQATVGSRLD